LCRERVYPAMDLGCGLETEDYGLP
jgi:hypothetical protein